MWDWMDVFSLSWFVPLILDSMMAVAMSVYDYFVGNGDGVVYVLIWGWLAFTIGLYLIKMYFPPLRKLEGPQMFKTARHWTV